MDDMMMLKLTVYRATVDHLKEAGMNRWIDALTNECASKLAQDDREGFAKVCEYFWDLADGVEFDAELIEEAEKFSQMLAKADKSTACAILTEMIDRRLTQDGYETSNIEDYINYLYRN